MALLLAAHEPRLKGCVAYAPCADVEERLGVFGRFARARYGQLAQFIRQSSPKTHAQQLNCPIYLVHARDDENVPFEESDAFVKQLQAAGKNVTFDAVATGDHYDEMLQPAIPRAIKWMKEQNGAGAK